VNDQVHIEIDTESVARFFFWRRLWFVVPKYGPRWARLQAERLTYRLDRNVLHADSGLVWFQRKAIPLTKITDVNLFQGPIARLFGLWSLRIETAGSPYPEAIVWGPTDPEAARDTLLASIAREKETDHSSNKSMQATPNGAPDG
jgi:membrane protein YdbS with pleckstrin-like domain